LILVNILVWLAWSVFSNSKEEVTIHTSNPGIQLGLKIKRRMKNYERKIYRVNIS
jgi:hypothetical protein